MNSHNVDDHGIIRSPGKFEGAPRYLPYFWDMSLDGASDDAYDVCGIPTDFFIVDNADRAAYPELEDIYALSMWESDQGFVYHKTYQSSSEYEAARALAQEDDEES